MFFLRCQKTFAGFGFNTKGMPWLIVLLEPMFKDKNLRNWFIISSPQSRLIETKLIFGFARSYFRLNSCNSYFGMEEVMMYPLIFLSAPRHNVRFSFFVRLESKGRKRLPELWKIQLDMHLGVRLLLGTTKWDFKGSPVDFLLAMPQ